MIFVYITVWIWKILHKAVAGGDCQDEITPTFRPLDLESLPVTFIYQLRCFISHIATHFAEVFKVSSLLALIYLSKASAAWPT